MSPVLAGAIQLLAKKESIEVVHLRAKFHEDTPDPVWIAALGEEGDWIIISGDARISTNPANRAAWRESGLTAFFFGAPWNNDSHWKKAASLVRWWPTIMEVSRKNPTGCGFLLPKKGSEPQLLPKK